MHKVYIFCVASLHVLLRIHRLYIAYDTVATLRVWIAECIQSEENDIAGANTKTNNGTYYFTVKGAALFPASQIIEYVAWRYQITIYYAQCFFDLYFNTNNNTLS